MRKSGERAGAVGWRMETEQEGDCAHTHTHMCMHTGGGAAGEAGGFAAAPGAQRRDLDSGRCPALARAPREAPQQLPDPLQTQMAGQGGSARVCRCANVHVLMSVVHLSVSSLCTRVCARLCK